MTVAACWRPSSSGHVVMRQARRMCNKSRKSMGFVRQRSFWRERSALLMSSVPGPLFPARRNLSSPPKWFTSPFTYIEYLAAAAPSERDTPKDEIPVQVRKEATDADHFNGKFYGLTFTTSGKIDFIVARVRFDVAYISFVKHKMERLLRVRWFPRRKQKYP